MIMINSCYNEIFNNKGTNMALPRIDKETAIQLRKAGFSYGFISQYLKCSYQWCAIKLNGIEPEYEHMEDCANYYLECKKIEVAHGEDLQ